MVEYVWSFQTRGLDQIARPRYAGTQNAKLIEAEEGIDFCADCSRRRIAEVEKNEMEPRFLGSPVGRAEKIERGLLRSICNPRRTTPKASATFVYTAGLVLSKLFEAAMGGKMEVIQTEFEKFIRGCAYRAYLGDRVSFFSTR